MRMNIRESQKISMGSNTRSLVFFGVPGGGSTMNPSSILLLHKIMFVVFQDDLLPESFS